MPIVSTPSYVPAAKFEKVLEFENALALSPSSSSWKELGVRALEVKPKAVASSGTVSFKMIMVPGAGGGGGGGGGGGSGGGGGGSGGGRGGIISSSPSPSSPSFPESLPSPSSSSCPPSPPSSPRATCTLAISKKVFREKLLPNTKSKINKAKTAIKILPATF